MTNHKGRPSFAEVEAARGKASEAIMALNLKSPEERTPEEIALVDRLDSEALRLAVEANTALVHVSTAEPSAEIWYPDQTEGVPHSMGDFEG